MIRCKISYRMADNSIADATTLMKIAQISRNTFNKLFHNNNIKSIKLETLMKVCDALDCRLSDLVEYIPDQILEAENTVRKNYF